MTNASPPRRAGEGNQAPLRVVCFSAHAPSADELAEAVAAVVPGAEVETGDLAMTLDPPEGDLFIVDGTADAARAMELVRIIRARGAAAPVAFLSGDSGPPEPEALKQTGAVSVVPVADLPLALPDVLDGALAQAALAAGSPGFAALRAAVQETRRLISAGLIARRVKHDINNPLAALLAEAQLLELESMPPEQMESVQRMVELCRRMSIVARRLEGPPGRSDGANPEASGRGA